MEGFTMSTMNKDLVFLIMQFLKERNWKDALHKLEQESGLFFDMNYFERLVINGDWDHAESYLSGFTKVTDNRYSTQIYFEMRKQKYLEALDEVDRGKAAEILMTDLRVYSNYNEELFKEMTQLLTLENFRENVKLSNYDDARSARTIMFSEIKWLIEMNPLFQGKLQFPQIRKSRLPILINQSLNWQHSFCGNLRQNPDVRMLFVDHSCGTSNDMPTLANVAFQPNMGLFHAPSVAVLQNGLNIRTRIPASMPGITSHGAVARARLSQAMLRGGTSSRNQNGRSTDKLPKTVARVLDQGSTPTSFDFHPVQQTILLVGTHIGDISLLEVSSRQTLVSRNFQIWDIGAKSMTLKASVIKDPHVSVQRVLWCHEGSLFGVAYSKHVVQLYTYHGGRDIRPRLELDAHIGQVNDLAFCSPNNQLYVLTCGDDKTIKVWDALIGTKLYTFEGHNAAVNCVLPHTKDGVNFVLSTSKDGKIKTWLYDNMGPRVDFDSPGRSCFTLAYSTNGKRLFSCGTNQDGESHLVEYIETDGGIKITYHGLCRRSPTSGIIQFDTTRNRFLAVADDHSIKFWDMDSPDLLETIDAEGGLPASPCIRFNKGGTLLAVSANNHRIKIVATTEGLHLMHSFEGSQSPELLNQSTMTWKLSEINDPAMLCSLRLSPRVQMDKIVRLVYTNSGTGILALSLNGMHLLWKWPRNDQATTKVIPELSQQASGNSMVNDLVDEKPVKAVPCLALSKNDCYIMSSSGGKLSLFNLVTFKIIKTMMLPPPAATSIAFHPLDNNLMAIGTDACTINIFNARFSQVMRKKLNGHSKRVTGLAFCTSLNTLVSSGSNGQILEWSCDSWERRREAYLKIPIGRDRSFAMWGTQVEFHKDHTHLLVVHESRLAIYGMKNFDCACQWIVGEDSVPISHATYSCDSEFIYSCFFDGSLRVFDSSNLQLLCLINPRAYLPSQDIKFRNSMVYPLAIAAHPQSPNQFAAGLTNGGVYVFEPLESRNKWGVPPAVEDRPPSSSNPPTVLVI